MTLIEESDKYILIVSPYVKVSKWYKLLKKLNQLKDRNIQTEFIIRDDITNQRSFDELDEIGVRYKAIPDLHCKLYLNEKYAIVSSMNLLLSSEINSLELAYRTETIEEYEELIDFCKRHLDVSFNKSIQLEESATPKLTNEITKVDYSKYYFWPECIEDELSKSLQYFVKLNEENGKLNIKIGNNNFYCYIWQPKIDIYALAITGILSKKEYNYLSNNLDKLPMINDSHIGLTDGGSRNYDTIRLDLNIPLRSENLLRVYNEDRPVVFNTITSFIQKVERIKKRLN